MAPREIPGGHEMRNKTKNIPNERGKMILLNMRQCQSFFDTVIIIILFIANRLQN